jgi:predicted ATPase
MPDALAAHDGIVRKAVASRNGEVFSTGGDAFAAAFGTAADAAAAALAIQEELGAAGSPLRVRIGVHTGTADERDGDYFGPTLNRAARLRDIGHGGQILCSAVTAGLLADEATPKPALVDLGEHRLKDLGRPERIFQIGTVTFGPLRSLDAYRHNLPVQPTAFVGREVDVQAISDLVCEKRLVVLTGVGGVGKTRLATQVAAATLEDFPGGTFFIDLAPVSEPTLVASTITNTIGLAPADATTTPERQLVSWMAERRALIVLDNCEHLVDACAELVGAALAANLTSGVLATSREAFGIDGEHDWQVGSLPEPTSRQLFASRAVAVRSGFAIDATNEAAVGEICRRLDGIALAIELAAARVSHLSPAQIAERLGDRFRLLTGARHRVQRQQTLRATLDWSHDLLNPAERVLFRRLAVFNASFALQAVEGICPGDGIGSDEVLDLLGSLVAKSLVTAQEDGRFRLLETLRLYGEERLVEADEAERRRDGHRDWFLGWAESFPSDQSLFSMEVADRMEADHDNVVAAVAWSLAQGRADLVGRLSVATNPMWRTYHHWDEASQWLRAALGDASSLEPDLRVACGAWAAQSAMVLMRGDMLELARAATEVEGASATGPVAFAWALLATFAATVAEFRGDPNDARLESALQRALTVHGGEGQWRILVLGFAAGALMTVGRYGKAAVLAEECLTLASSTQDLVVAFDGGAHAMLVVAWHLLGDHARSLAEAERGLRVDAIRRGRSTSVIGSLAFDGWALAAAGDVDRGRALALENLAVSLELKIPLRDAEVLIVLGGVEAVAGDWARASVLLAAGRALGEGPLFGFRSPPGYALYKHYLPLVREHLDVATARASRDRGRAMTLKQAVEYARAREVT